MARGKKPFHKFNVTLDICYFLIYGYILKCMPIYYSKITHATMFYIISVRIKKKLAFFFPFEQTKCVCMKNLYKTGGRVSYFF